MSLSDLFRLLFLFVVFRESQLSVYFQLTEPVANVSTLIRWVTNDRGSSSHFLPNLLSCFDSICLSLSLWESLRRRKKFLAFSSGFYNFVVGVRGSSAFSEVLRSSDSRFAILLSSPPTSETPALPFPSKTCMICLSKIVKSITYFYGFLRTLGVAGKFII